jgi:hypothetical protein
VEIIHLTHSTRNDTQLPQVLVSLHQFLFNAHGMIVFITFTDNVGTIGAEYAKEMDSHVAIVLSLMLAIHPVATF